jgi:hypothetical protein
MNNNDKKKYLITESVQIDFEIEATSAEEARDLYFEAFEKMFSNTKITCESSDGMTCYQKTKDGLVKDTSI